MRGNTLYIVVPCYNEEEVLPETARRLGDKLKALMNAGKISPQSRVLFVNDGSKDRTWEVITRLHRENPLLCGADLSRNRGHQNALLAGLMTASQKKNFLNGPGKVCAGMNIDRRLNGLRHGSEELYLCGSLAELGLPVPEPDLEPPDIKVGKRVGIDYAQEAVDFPWRFYV